MNSSPDAQKHKLSAAGNVFLWGLIVWVATQVPGVLLLKHNDWREDGLGLDRRSAAWSSGRQYSSELEEGLGILNQIEPRQVAYLRSRGNPILFIPCANGRRGYTSNPEGVVHICQQYRSDPAEIAAVLSHEIVHLERRDPNTGPSEHSSCAASSATQRSRKRIGRSKDRLATVAEAPLHMEPARLAVVPGDLLAALADLSGVP